MGAEEVENLSLGELHILKFLEELVLTCFHPVQMLKNLLAEMRINIIAAQFLVRIININSGRRIVDGHGAIRGFPRDLHPEEARGGDQLFLADEGFIGERDAKVLKDFGEEAPKRKELVKMVVSNKREDDGGVVDGKRRINAINKFGEIF